MEFWQKQTAQDHHQDDHISNSHVFVRFQHCISLQMLSYFRMAYLWNRRSNLTSEKGKIYQNAENHHPDDHISNSHVFVKK